jgi:uroporphyrinogen-III synthase
MRKLLLLRPEPGLSVSAERARAMGLEVVACPLFQVEPLEWQPPNPADYDALLLTSANAVRHGGNGLEALKSLPAHAVGESTAACARQAGFRVDEVGTGSVADLLAASPVPLRLLHLAGEDRREPLERHHQVDARIVYRSIPIENPGLPSPEGLVAAVHSPRAGRRLAELATIRGLTAIAAISAAAAEACGGGWERVEVADRPDDSSLLALGATLCHTSNPA